LHVLFLHVAAEFN